MTKAQAEQIDEKVAEQAAMPALPSVSTAIYYIVAICFIVAIAAGAVVHAPDKSVEVLAFAGSIIVALLAILKAQTEVHHAVNSKMERLLNLVEESALAKGKLAGKQEQQDETAHDGGSEGA